MSLQKSTCSLDISLLPEFGWSIKDQPVYGPGSVFQGIVKLKLLSRVPNIEKVKLSFRAYECIPPFEISPGVLRKARSNLFAVQRTLWSAKCDGAAKKFEANSEYTFPFTIQMALLQLPPSANHPAYQCKYQLVASLETSKENDAQSAINTSVQCSKDVLYMPYIETKLLKKPILLEARRGHLSVHAEISSFDYVPNDTIPITMSVSSFKMDRKSPFKYVTIQAKLVRVVQVIAFEGIKDHVETVKVNLHKMLLISCPAENHSNDIQNTPCHNNDQHLYCCKATISLHIPADVTPNVDYGRLAQIRYKLQLSVQQKGPMGGIWNYNTKLEDIPLNIGTLGYGIGVSPDLKFYSKYYPAPASSYQSNRNVPNSHMPTPMFMKAIEYEDALPLYEPHRLPTYSASQLTV
ncbi:hypothetical protein BDF20DRAFT_885152 [Mycotypha africana]|uniref:uncharacterized protein n=1 Tax=Mycotypha africana TaxID=64632 RepID=UPI002300DEF5|nr:uncharacterized protein BDF20DRAFT_885152 [Mycotypha africana]KAI8971573.1 hypothetical protein BDF20DRAFT_885152 [Mycotypha africana]